VTSKRRIFERNLIMSKILHRPPDRRDGDLHTYVIVGAVTITVCPYAVSYIVRRRLGYSRL